ncbi:MAG: hypothetical protein ACXVCV_22550, partial [Polyangia bacterium]
MGPSVRIARIAVVGAATAPTAGRPFATIPSYVQPQDVRDSIGGLPTRMSAGPGSAAPRSTGFGATSFDLAADAVAPRRPGPDSAFDVCHVGVVLRAVVFVHGVTAIGMVFGAASFAAWLTLTAAGASVALP